MFSSMGWLIHTAYQCLVMIPKIWNSKLLHLQVHVVAVLKRYTISYLGVIRGVQNFTPVLKIHTP